MAERDATRIGLVIGQLGYGGAEGQLFELARALRERFPLSVYCLSACTEPYGAKLSSLGIEVRAFSARAGLDVGRVLALRRALIADRIEIVHAFLYIATAYAYLASLGLPGARLVSSARNCKPEPSRLRRAIMRRAFRRSDAVICNSREMASFAAEYYRAPSRRTHVVYNGVDAERFAGAASRHVRAVRAGSDVGPVVGTVGRIERQKNLDLFLDAAARVVVVHPRARFEIVGEGSERARLERRVESLGLAAAVRFRGTTNDVAAFFGEIDQFWLTSDWEGTPNVVLEAMAAGLPVVATRAGGTAELVEDGRTGFLVAPGDVSALSARALALASEPLMGSRVGAAARAAVIERFSLTRMAADTAAVYDTVASAA